MDLAGTVPTGELHERLLERWHSHTSICKPCMQVRASDQSPATAHEAGSSTAFGACHEWDTSKTADTILLSSMCMQAFKVFTACQHICMVVAGVAAMYAVGAFAAGVTLRTPRPALSVIAAVAGADAAAAGLLSMA